MPFWSKATGSEVSSNPFAVNVCAFARIALDETGG